MSISTGVVCLPILRAAEDWNPTTSLADVVKAIVNIIDNPNTDFAMSPGKFILCSHFSLTHSFCLTVEILKEYNEKNDEYVRTAKQMVKDKALPRN